MTKNNSLSRVLLVALLIVLIGEMTKMQGMYVYLAITMSIIILLFLTIYNRINLLELLSVLVIVASYGQILRGANGFVSYITLGLMILSFLFIRRFTFKLPLFVVFILFTQALSHLIFYQGDLIEVLLGFISLTGILSVTLLIKSIVWNKYNIIFFLQSLMLIPILNILVVVFEYAKMDNVKLFLLDSNVNFANDISSIVKYGTFGSSELLGEFSMLIYLISINLIVHRKSFRIRGFSIFYFGILFSIILAFLSVSRSVIVLVLLITIITFVIRIRVTYNLLIPSLMLLSVISVLDTNDYFELVTTKFSSDPNFLTTFINDPLKARGTSRELVFEKAIAKISSQPFIIGDGYKISESNKKTWFGDGEYFFADYHNLYYSIVPLFGWLVLVTFIYIYFKAIIRCFKNYTRAKDDFSQSLFIILLLFLIVLFVGEFKISALRTGGYFFIYTVLFYFAYLLATKKELVN